MKTESALPGNSLPKDNTVRKVVIPVLHGLGCGVAILLSARWVANFQGSVWIKLPILALPWVLAALSIRHIRLNFREDELEMIISRDALAFTGWGLFGLLILVNQLQKAGVLEKFKWETGQVLLLVVFLLCGGMLWSYRRFR